MRVFVGGDQCVGRDQRLRRATAAIAELVWGISENRAVISPMGACTYVFFHPGKRGGKRVCLLLQEAAIKLSEGNGGWRGAEPVEEERSCRVPTISVTDVAVEGQNKGTLLFTGGFSAQHIRVRARSHAQA